jgi:hypothetical protein
MKEQKFIETLIIKIVNGEDNAKSKCITKASS